MENYIIRIYRRDNNEKALAGIVEIVSTQEQKSFTTNEELLSILSAAKAEAKITWEIVQKK